MVASIEGTRRAPPEFKYMFKLLLITGIYIFLSNRLKEDAEFDTSSSSQNLQDTAPGTVAVILTVLDALRKGDLGGFIPTSSVLGEYFHNSQEEVDNF